MYLFDVFLLILGLTFGSFIGALTYRYPKKISNNHGRSFCDSCKTQIKWYDNIPLLSFLFLGGKCRNCKESISWRYFLIELITGIGFLLTFKGGSLQGVYNIVLFLILETIFVIDFENQIIPDVFIFAGVVLVFLQLLISGSEALFPSLLSGFIAAAFLLLIHLLTKGKGMGLGDVKFAFLGGMIVGLPLFPIWMLMAFLTGAAVGIILIIGKKAGLKSKIAFGPFLVAVIPLTLIWAEKIMHLLSLS